MIVAFPYAHKGYEKLNKRVFSGQLFVDTFRSLSPSDRLVQMTDAETAALKGVDECFRMDSDPFGIWYFEASINFPHNEYLRLDTDVVVRTDVSEVFNEKFDIAIADEHNSRSHNYLGMVTLNAGVMFVRNREFFKESLKNYREKTGMDNWQDLQIAMQMTINSGRFLIHRLDPAVYNYYPKNDDSPHPEKAKILHYKGKRKNRMIRDYSPMLSAA